MQGDVPTRKPSDGVEANKATLVQAALELISEEGIFGGLSPAEVAKRAGSHRSWVYKYFGGRRGLLREALRREVRQWVPDIGRARNLRFVDRVLSAMEATANKPGHVQIMTTLLLDGDDDVNPMPLQQKTRQSFIRDIDAGSLDPDIDLDALTVIVGSLMWGYALYRDAFAHALNVEVSELHGRAMPYLRSMLEALATAPSALDDRVSP